MLRSAGERFFPEELLGLCAQALAAARAINIKVVIDLMTFPPFLSDKSLVAALGQRPRSWITELGKAPVVGHCSRADLGLRDGCPAHCAPVVRTEMSCRNRPR